MNTSASSRSKLTNAERRKDGFAALSRDCGFSFRQFRRAPILVAGIVLSLGFGIGASGTVFSWMEGTVLDPLPSVHDVGRLISVRPDARHGAAVSVAEFNEWRAEMRTVSDLVATSITLFAVQPNPGALGPGSHPLFGMYVSAGYFELLGVRASLGRTFIPEEDREGAGPVAVLSDAAWKRYFGGSSQVIGREVRINGRLARLVGVAPANFGGNLSIAAFDIWLPLHAQAEMHAARADVWHQRDVRWLDVIGRLRDGVTLAQADAEIRAIARRQAATFVENRGREAHAAPLDLGEAAQLKPVFTALVVVMAFVVLLICANVANLLLARAATRSRELAVRLSLGASRGRLVRQLMTESVLLATLGAALGLVLAVLGYHMLWIFVPESSIPIHPQWELNARFLGFVGGLAGACVIAFGLAPAVAGSRVELVETLKNGARGTGGRKSRMRTYLVVVQFALAMSALVSAAMFLRFDRSLRALALGFRGGDRVLLIETDMALAGYREVAKWQQTLEVASERVSALPQVESTALANFVPLGLVGYFRKTVEIPGHHVLSGDADRVLVDGVSAGYFDLMRIPIVQGRAITTEDRVDSRRVVVINQAFATRYFPDRTPLGQTIRLDSVEHVVVGVTPTGRYDYRSVERGDTPVAYFALAQQPSSFVTLHVRTRTDPLTASNDIRQAVWSVDPNISFLKAKTLDAHVGVAFALAHSAAAVLACLAGAALLLASMGLFSVVSYGVALRTKEIGIRIAIGATRTTVMRMIVLDAVRLGAYGSVAGTAVAGAISIMLRSRITRLPAAAPTEFLLPLIALVISATIAALVPGWRAASVDPARTLRTD